MLQEFVNEIGAAPNVAVMLELAANEVPFRVLLDPTFPELLAREIEGR